MAIFSIRGFSWPRRGSGSSDGDNFSREPIYLGDSKAGVKITREVMMQASAMYCGARVISQGIAQNPFKLFSTEVDVNGNRKRTVARDHPAYKLLADQPNDFQTAFSFFETLIMHAIFDHGGFAYISRKRSGEVIELLPIVPDHISPVWSDEKRALEYHWDAGEGKPRILPPNDVLHVRGPSWDGFSGIQAMQVVKEAIGLSVALERGHAQLFEKGGRPSGILSSATKLGQETVDSMREAWQGRFGAGGAGGVAVLDGDWSFSAMQMSAVDAQYVETRKFQIEEISRYLVLFPQMLMQGDNMNFASVSEFFRAHVVHSLAPWAVRVEGEIKRTVLSGEGNENITPKVVLDGLMRGSPAERGEFYKTALGAGNAPAFMTQNEIRELEDLDRLDDEAADHLPVQANTTPINTTPEGENEN